ncbi:hypothetical protein DL98DRAFT_582236 [Cadophora sp. DSE1049]|nr:hypothetical protein DL98DRAFT_582236 [Cadophora sp. DSE1049]
MSTFPTSSSKRHASRSLEPPRKLTTAEYVTKMTQSVLIDVFVGPENKHFSLPKDLLCHHSPVFEVMLSGQFKEGK